MPVAAPVRTVLQNVGYLRIPSVLARIYRVSRKETRGIDARDPTARNTSKADAVVKRLSLSND